MPKTTLLLPKFVLSKMSHEIEHSESEFYYPGKVSHAELLHQSPTHFKSKERNLTLLAAHNFLGSLQANRQSRKQRFRINCPITNLYISKQSQGETSFLGRHHTYLVCGRINCSVVSTSVLFEETKLNANTSSLPHSSSR